MPTKTVHPVLALLRPRGGIKAVVDWVELEFTTPTPTHFNDLRRWLKVPQVEPLNPRSDHRATQHRAKFHDPESFAQVAQRLRRAGVNEQAARIVGIEVAVDFYARDNDRATLAQITAYRYKFAAHLASNPLAGEKGHRIEGDHYNERNTLATAQDFQSGHTVYAGDHGNRAKGIQATPEAQRWYVKTVDQGQELVPELWRSRSEDTLQDAGLPFATLAQASGFDFTKLAPRFALRKLKDDLTPQQQFLADASMQLGARRTVKVRQGGRREFSRLTEADTELNQRIRDALKCLTARVRRPCSSEIKEFHEPAHRGKRGVRSINCVPVPTSHQEQDQQAQGSQANNQDNAGEQLALLSAHLDQRRDNDTDQTEDNPAGEQRQRRGAADGKDRSLSQIRASGLPSIHQPGSEKPTLIEREAPGARQSRAT